MSDLLRWFGEQSEAVKLALLGMLSGVGLFVSTIVREWRKPVLAAPGVNTTATAPRSQDDPTVLMLGEIAAINVNLAQLLAETTKQGDEQGERIMKVLDAISKLTNELYLLRNIIDQRGMGM